MFRTSIPLTKGWQGGKLRKGHLQQKFMLYPSPLPHRGNNLLPGFHKYRWQNPEVTKHDITLSVDRPDSINKFNTSRCGTALTKFQSDITQKPAHKYTNFSYHYDDNLYQWLRILNGVSRKTNTKNPAGATPVEATRRAFHHLKIREITARQNKKDDKNPITMPRQLLTKAIVLNKPLFYPKRMVLVGSEKKFKGSIRYSITPRQPHAYQARSMVLRAMRNDIRRTRPWPKRLELMIADSIEIAARGKGPAAKQKANFHNVCVTHRTNLEW